MVVPPFIPDLPGVRKDLTMYYDEISRFDEHIGQIIDELNKQGILDQTIIMIISDNGRPFPRSKSYLYDSGIKMPMIIRYPAEIKSNTSCPSLVSALDIAPTLLELAGIGASESVQGKSFRTLFSQPDSPFREAIFAEHNWHAFQAHERCVRTRRNTYIRNAFPKLPGLISRDYLWYSKGYPEIVKLHQEGTLDPRFDFYFTPERPEEELYDLSADPLQMRNVIGLTAYGSVADSMRNLLDVWIRDTHDAIPVHPKPDWFDRWDGREVEHSEYHQTKIPSTLELLPMDEIKPGGWIKAQLIRDLDSGFTGHLGGLTHYASSDIFGDHQILGYKTGEEGTREFIQKSWWPGETEPVWLDGYLRAAFLSGHPEAMAKMHAYMEYIIDHQEESGYIGIYLPEARYNHTTENAELWSQSRILRVMLAYYEFTGDQRVLTSVLKAVALTMDQYKPGRGYFGIANPGGGVSHGLMFTDILEWLYRLTGDGRYVEFGDFLYADYSNFDNDRLNDSRMEDLADPDREIVGHTPHVAEHLRVPVWLYHATGKEKYRDAYELGYAKLEKYMVPSGAIHSGDKEDVEGIPPTPDMPYEYCGITELFDTQRFLLEKTGNTRYADMGERLVLNAGQGARFSDGKGVCYFSRDNRLKATTEGSGGRFKFSPTHEDIAVCCNPNAAKLMPYFVGGMWMKKHNDPGALITLFYGPAWVKTTLNGSWVEIEQETGYPFSDTINFRVEPEKENLFELWLRIPEWCNELNIHIENARISERDGFKIIRKNWRHGDSFQVTFAAGIQNVEAVNGEIAFQRGPLLYALPIPQEKKAIKHYPVPGFADYEVTPTRDDLWDLHLEPRQLKHGAPFAFQNDAPCSRQYPWDGSPFYVKGNLHDSDGHSINVTLVPMGTTMLRRLTFPVN